MDRPPITLYEYTESGTIKKRDALKQSVTTFVNQIKKMRMRISYLIESQLRDLDLNQKKKMDGGRMEMMAMEIIQKF